MAGGRVIGSDGGPWLVICHGMAGSYREFLPFAEAAAERGWRVLLWDMPAHGGSPPPVAWTLGAMTDALEAVLAGHDVERPVLLGFSFGGMVAQDWLRRHPGEAAGLIAYGCLAPFSQAAPVPRWLAGPVMRLLYGLRSWTTIREHFARLCAVSAKGRTQVKAAMEPLGKAGFIAMSAALLRGFTPDPAFRVDCPLLLVRGAEDSNAALLDKAEAGLLALRPDAERVRIADAGHCAHLDQSAAFARALWPFLDALRPGAPQASRSAVG